MFSHDHISSIADNARVMEILQKFVPDYFQVFQSITSSRLCLQILKITVNIK